MSMAALNVTIYKKALVISNETRRGTSIGETVNLISVDIEAIATLASYLQNLLWSGAFQIIVSMAMLYRLLGVSLRHAAIPSLPSPTPHAEFVR